MFARLVDLFSSDQGICALRIAHIRSLLPLRKSPTAAFETVATLCLGLPAIYVHMFYIICISFCLIVVLILLADFEKKK